MKEKFLFKILASNPDAKRDEQVIKDAMKSLNELRQMGVSGNGYDLQSPFSKDSRFLSFGKNKAL